MSAPEPPPSTREVRENHRFDEAKLEAWWKDAVGPTEGLVVRQFAGGQSNPTFWIGDGARGYVLRKKPPGKLLPKAHMVEREHRVMKALAETDVPVPEMVALCEDAEVIGTPFFVMEQLEGRIFWNVQLPKVETPAERTALYEELARVLAAIHQVDVEAVGLADFGRPSGYVERQVARWTMCTLPRCMAKAMARVKCLFGSGLLHGLLSPLQYSTTAVDLALRCLF